MTGAEIALIAIAAAGTAVSIASAQSQAKSQQAIMNRNADLANRDAAINNNLAKENARRKRRAVRIAMGSMRARGYSMDLLEDSAKEGELQAQDILYRGKLGLETASMQADTFRFQGQVAQSQANAQSASAILNLAGTAGGIGVQSGAFASTPSFTVNGLPRTQSAGGAGKGGGTPR